MAREIPNLVAVRICEALGLAPNDLQSLRLVFETGREPIVVATMWVREKAGDEIAEALDRVYKLVPVAEAAESRSLGEDAECFSTRRR